MSLSIIPTELVNKLSKSSALLYIGITMAVLPACLGGDINPKTAADAACASSPHPEVCQAGMAVANDPEDKALQLALANQLCKLRKTPDERESCALAVRIIEFAREGYEDDAMNILKAMLAHSPNVHPMAPTPAVAPAAAPAAAEGTVTAAPSSTINR